MHVKKNWCAKKKVDTRVLSEWKCRLLKEVKDRIKSVKKNSSFSRRTKKMLDDETVKIYLQDFHDKFVITPTDKAGNKFSIVCKQFYIECLLKELTIVGTSKTEGTYKMLKSSQGRILNAHKKYMNLHHIPIDDSQTCLPFLYWIPKMHKTPSKQRFIAASHSCTTKPLSKMITFCLKLIQNTCTNFCKVINKTRGFNRMWIVNNSVEVLDQISGCNKRNKVRNVRTYDFSTLYTSIPHKSLKEQLA